MMYFNNSRIFIYFKQDFDVFDLSIAIISFDDLDELNASRDRSMIEIPQ